MPVRRGKRFSGAALAMEGIESVCARGILTADVGGTANTADVTQAVVAFIEPRAKVAETAEHCP